MIGKLLRNVRAGTDKSIWAASAKLPAPEGFVLLSPNFDNGAPMPAAFISKLKSPALRWEGVPGDARSLLLIAEDPDVPLPSPVRHLFVEGIPAISGAFAEDELTHAEIALGRMGRNGFLQRRWLPPAPPKGHGTHRYIFTLVALRCPPGRHVAVREVIDVIAREGLARTTLIGTFER